MEVYKEHLLKKIFRDIFKKDGQHWERIRKKSALDLFHKVAGSVPGYKTFLKEHNILSSDIKTFENFSRIPTISKDNYLRKYKLKSLVWNGTIDKQFTFTSTSGSTGDPYYFPRSLQLDQESSLIHELFLRQITSFKGPILIIDGFSMGVWIGGLITYNAFTLASRRENIPASIITTGINKHEILKILTNLAPQFHTTVITGYPPFIKDIVDAALFMKIDLKKLNLHLLFAAELFSEKFRDHISKNAGVKNPYLDTMNVYGSSDIGTMAFESPLSILIRRAAVGNRNLHKALFGTTEKLPTLAQYNPVFICFQEEKGHLILTGNSGIPLVRYEIGDNGGILSFAEVLKIGLDHEVDFLKLAIKEGLQNYLYQLPFVFVFERSDFSTTLYGLQIYPETIKLALLDRELTRYATGRFTLITRYSSKQDQYLEINIELKDGVKETKTIQKLTLQKIINTLRARNAEFKELHKFLGARAFPKLIFYPKEHIKYFKPGVKQEWTRKNP